MSSSHATGAGTPAAGRSPAPSEPPAVGHAHAAAPATGPGPAAVTLAGLTDHLTALADRDVAALLAARPDLTTPPSGSFTALAVRASGRTSVDAALAELDAPTLAVAEGVVVLASLEAPTGPGTDDDGATLVGRLASALGLPPDDVAPRLDHLTRLALVVGARPVAGLVETFGPHPAGLGPVAPVPPGLPGPVADGAGGPPTTSPGPAPAPVPAAPVPPPLPELLASPDGLPAESLHMLEVLTWGPPVGTLRAGADSSGADALVARSWLVRATGRDTRTRLVLPRHVGLALRGGRLHREPVTAPDPSVLDRLPADAVAAESARAAGEVVRLVRVLLRDWDREPAPVLRSGGVGVRALARTADALGTDPATAATVVELAAGADLLALDELGTSWVPSTLADAWAAAPLPEAWAPLAATWATCLRTPWLVGTRGDDGTLRSVLSADLDRAWSFTLRRRVLTLLAALPDGATALPGYVRAALTYARPRRPVPQGAVSAVLSELGLLGLTGGGALASSGRALAVGLGPEPSDPASPTDLSGLLGALEDTLATDLPTPVDSLIVQSDLTALVPGTPTDALAALLGTSAVVESRGAALAVRFTPESVRAALDAGTSADALLAALGSHALGELPSALTALVRDQARRHGAVRVRAVRSALTVTDPALAAGLLADAALGDLDLTEVAPGVLLSGTLPGELLRRLREHGLAPVLEDASGRVVLADGAAGRRHRPAPSRPGSTHPVHRRQLSRRDLAGLVGRLRAGQQASGASAREAADPVHALALLRQAQSSGARLRLRLAAGDGSLQERRVRVLAVEAGRVRLADVVRETELTVAVHRIAWVGEDA